MPPPPNPTPDPTAQGPPPPKKFKLIHDEARTVAKREVCILLESILVSSECFFYQVMDHTDNLNQLSDDLSNVQTSIDEIEDRTTAAETNIILLESEINVLDARASDIEQILYGKRVPVCKLITVG